jgi:hypothetical protein
VLAAEDTREHAEDPAEGAEPGATDRDDDTEREHSEEAAEGEQADEDEGEQ